MEKGQAEDILLEADDFDPALEEEDLIMGDCETDEDDCCDWLNGEEILHNTVNLRRSLFKIIIVLKRYR